MDIAGRITPDVAWDRLSESLFQASPDVLVVARVKSTGNFRTLETRLGC